MTEQRRLAAILVADVVGYSKLMGSDEAGTLAQLEALRTEIIEPHIAKHAGRLFKSVGDGFLIEFASAVQAVSCARAIQEANDQGRLPLRIGIHVGDVVVQGDDLMGDGVNVAARVEGIADPGGIAITRAVHEQVRDKLDFGFTDKGEIELKNIQRPVQVFVIGGAKVEGQATALPLPDKPSIAVLPFQNMSGDPEQEYFVDGLVEDIITGLSRFKSLFVIARNSSFTFKGKAVDIKQVGRNLGVRYVLEGSVRKAANRLRITAQLVEGETGAHLWADRFDGALEDIFDLQDRVTEKVIAALAPSVERAEIERSARKTANLRAYDYFLRATAAYYKATPKDLADALAFAEQGLALDPTYARGHGLLAAIYSYQVITSSSTDLDADAAAAERSARKALELDNNDATILFQYGEVQAQLFSRREEGLGLFDKAIENNPNLAIAWAMRGICNGNLGNTAKAISDFEQALRLSPRDPLGWVAQHGLAWAHLMAGRYDEAIFWATAVLQLRPHVGFTLRVLIAAHAQAGRLDKATEALKTHMSIAPDARLSTLRASYLRRISPQAFEALSDGLRKAGFPE